MKQYDSIKLEAARFERDAQRINLENAVIEGEKLRKEAAILDIELDTVSFVIKKESLSVVIQENYFFSTWFIKRLHLLFSNRSESISP